ncbi:TlpA family protein disulfide reductase [Anaeromyxobacter diazotrophicus]|uniref:TlpA family protein disulfide reductase n=1 Tax=Anaeromyxobacter diazotrophicus TaxID=2590199 RepID=UPI001592A489|nr:TlpA disulfide reductase family protein [Anaeromyxobacter diazotrophicus]
MPRPLLALAALAASGACAHRAVPPSWAARAELPFVALTLDGERVVVGGPGPPRLVEVWATWCAPCGPAAERARAVLARHPRVAAYAVSVDEDRAALEQRLAERPPPGRPLVLPGGPAAAARRGLRDFPTFLALDARGRLVGVEVGLSPGLGPRLDRMLRHAEGLVGEGE